ARGRGPVSRNRAGAAACPAFSLLLFTVATLTPGLLAWSWPSRRGEDRAPRQVGHRPIDGRARLQVEAPAASGAPSNAQLERRRRAPPTPRRAELRGELDGR